jgi:hypothetical protein
MTTNLRKWVAFGTGVGIEIAPEELQVTIARVRPNQVHVLGAATVQEYRTRPAAEWGIELSTFLRQIGCGHVAATVLLPRTDLIVRQIQLPGVADRDLEAAVQLQIDALHPFADQPVLYSYARIGRTASILIGIARKEIVDRYATLFAEAGIKVASFTFSAAVLYSAVRLKADPSRPDFFIIRDFHGDLEVYGESETRPIYSANWGRAPQRVATLAISELRLNPDAEPAPLGQVLPTPSVFPSSHDPAGEEFARHAMAYATALVGSCPHLAISGNLLPPDQRRTSSRIRLVPSIALGAILLVLAAALAAQSSFENARYLRTIQGQIRRLEPQARRGEAIDREVVVTRGRTQMLDEFRRRSKADMDALNELTKLIAPPGWITSLEMDRTTVSISGEVEQAAAALLKTLDGSALFMSSQFTMPIAQLGAGEGFRIRMQRENPQK